MKNLGNKNPESFKQRIDSKTSHGDRVHCGSNYFDVNPSITYRYSANVQEKAQNEIRIPIRK